MTEKPITCGFGVPNEALPHQFLVQIPPGQTKPVEIWEDFGAAAVGTTAQKLCRVELPRATWRKVADGVKAHLNRRLKEKSLKASRFATGSNRVERILGREICVLAWAIENATQDEASIAFTRWSSYRPEELWWLFQQIDRDGGEWDSPKTGWRIAIRHALLRNEDEAPATVRRHRPKNPIETNPDLFRDF
ncbi:anti-phage-associated DUF3780 domain-containing protein [Komagataeibacter europaeus]|uniref:anti-phage-associated DUF3780 domain-containing protein n=1 Tax=Komagataeibacter europaeus TaxID=33995 RepID=UPI000237E48A|nr:anti-phage-associated DUF3780 domain-containing protein [Komagataeibacter europaeus]